MIAYNWCINNKGAAPNFIAKFYKNGSLVYSLFLAINTGYYIVITKKTLSFLITSVAQTDNGLM
jgi:hypothetical protein